MRALAGANALVTGASGGIGPYLARALARAGANIAVSGRRVDALAALVIGAHDGAGHGSDMASPSLTGGLATRR